MRYRSKKSEHKLPQTMAEIYVQTLCKRAMFFAKSATEMPCKLFANSENFSLFFLLAYDKALKFYLFL